MKKFTINCDFGGQMAPFSIYVGVPEGGHHPLHFQAEWLSKERGGTIPSEVMDAFAEMKTLSETNSVSLEELCVYALGSEEEEGADSEAQEEPEEEEVVVEEIENDEGEKREVVTEHTEELEPEDMASEGGHVEEEDPEDK